jgi:hypothetical protein
MPVGNPPLGPTGRSDGGRDLTDIFDQLQETTASPRCDLELLSTVVGRDSLDVSPLTTDLCQLDCFQRSEVQTAVLLPQVSDGPTFLGEELSLPDIHREGRGAAFSNRRHDRSLARRDDHSSVPKPAGATQPGGHSARGQRHPRSSERSGRSLLALASRALPQASFASAVMTSRQAFCSEDDMPPKAPSIAARSWSEAVRSMRTPFGVRRSSLTRCSTASRSATT